MLTRTQTLQPALDVVRPFVPIVRIVAVVLDLLAPTPPRTGASS